MFVSRETQERLDNLEQENSDLRKQIGEMENSKPNTTPLRTAMIIGWVMFVLATALAIYLYENSIEVEKTDTVEIVTASGPQDWNVIPDSNIVYTVQIGAFAEFDIKPYAADLEGVYMFENDNLQKVSLGTFSTFNKAQEFLSEMSEMGLEFAYVVAYENGKPIGLMHAVKKQASEE